MDSNPVKQEIVGMFDRAASLYDQVGVRQFTYFADRLVAHLPIESGTRMLDLATGRGALLFAAAERAGSGGDLLGIDLAPAMVAATQAELERRGITQARVEVSDADEVSYPDHTFDVITCGSALHFLDYPRLLPRLRRMLVRGGHLGTTHHYVPTDDQENMARWAWLFTLTREVFPPDFVPPAAWVSPNRLNRPELITAALEQAGYSEIEVTREEVTLYFADEADWWAWEWSQGSRFWVEGMSPDGLATFKRVSFEHLREMMTPQGIPMKVAALLAVARA